MRNPILKDHLTGMKSLVKSLEDKIKEAIGNKKIEETLNKARINSDLIILKDMMAKTQESAFTPEVKNELATVISKGQFGKVNEFCKRILMKLQKNESFSVEKSINNEFERKVLQDLILLSQPKVVEQKEKEEVAIKSDDNQKVISANEDIDSYNKVMKGMMADDSQAEKLQVKSQEEKKVPEDSQDTENDEEEVISNEKAPFPEVFTSSISNQAIYGNGDVLEGLNLYLVFLDTNYHLNDVMRILSKKHRDKIVGNLGNLCGTEVIMWVRQELGLMFNNYEKAGWKYEERKKAEVELSDKLSDIVPLCNLI